MGEKISWFTFNPAGQSGAGIADIEDNNLTYTSSLSTAVATNEVVYAAEYDLENDCWSAGLPVKIAVVDNPVVTLTPPTDICATDGVLNIDVSPLSGTLTQTSSVSGFNDSARTWDPSGQTAATVSLDLEYLVEETYGRGTAKKTCSTTKTASVTSHFMETPIAESKIWLINDISSIPDNFMTASVNETGVAITWYDSETKDNIIPADENFSFTPDRNALQVEVDNLENQNNGYVKSYWITQTDDAGCESEPVEVTLTFTNNCPFLAPEVVGEEVCVGEALSDISASVPSSTTVPVDEWKWYDEAMNPITNNSNTYTHGVDNMLADTSIYHVSYIATDPVSNEQCETPTTEVSVIVNPLPEISITVPSDICYDAGEQAFSKTVDYHNNGEGSGAWAIDGGNTGITLSGVFYPSFNGEITNTYEISYTYTDGKGCENTERQDVTVQYTPAPTTVDHYSMVSYLQTVEVEATGLESGATVKWYETEISTPAISTDNPYRVISIQGNQEMDTTLYATQTVNGCESERAKADIIIYDCPVPAPDVTVESPICVYEDTPPILAEIGSEWLGGGSRPTGIAPEFRFYDSETSLTPIETNTTGEYVPNINKTTTGEYTFWVSEYNDNVLPHSCESARTPVTIKVYAVHPPSVADVEAVCQGESNNTFTAQDAVGTVEWYDETEPIYPAISGTAVYSGIMYTPGFVTVGVHSVYAVNKKEVEPGKTCVSQAAEGSIEIIERPEPPVMIAAEVCLGSSNKEVCASPMAGGYISWYGSSVGIIQLSYGECYRPTKSQSGVYIYYATETVDGCESEKAPVEYTVKPLPQPPVIIPVGNVCIYDGEQELEAIGENITWYKENNEIATGTTYTHEITAAGTIDYHATQTIGGCEGVKHFVRFTVIGEVAVPYASTKYMCEGGSMPILESNMSTTEWYSDFSALSLVGTGYSYTPDRSLLEVGENTFYMLNSSTVNSKTCYSDTASVTLHLTENCSDTSAPYFHETLGELIDSAETLLASAEEELKTLRLYQTGAISLLESAKANALDVYEDSYATQTEIDAAVEQLKQAITDFHAMEITAISDLDDMPFILYPNPARDYIAVSQGNSSNAISHIIIKNAAHIPVIETTKTRIDISALPPGTYICEIYTAEGVWQTVLVVE
jgi:hypothetical protein